VTDAANPARAIPLTPLLTCDARLAGDGAAVLALAGELDISTVADVEAELEALRERDVRRLTLDLRDVAFIDSTGLRLLVTLRHHGEDGGPPLSVVAGPPNVQRILEIAGLADVLDFVAPDQAHA
jgi:anti-anti-sigma factor